MRRSLAILCALGLAGPAFADSMAPNGGGAQNTTAAGTSASSAQAMQGVTNGVPLPVSGSTSDPNNAAFAGAVAMTVGTTYAVQRSVGVLATVAGNVTFSFPDASTLTLPVIAGWQTFPFACTSIAASGTTATATYYNLK